MYLLIEWSEFEKYCLSCTRCNLSQSRRNVVIGRGNKSAKLMLIGEGPGENEDIQGLPFVGQAGKLLDNLMNALEFNEDEYYIANIVKCRPPKNRVPSESEANACLEFLRYQVSFIKPKIIVCLGSTAMKYVIDKDAKITNIRGTWIEKKGFSFMPTFHPAALLRDESKKELLWNDMKKVKHKYSTI